MVGAVRMSGVARLLERSVGQVRGDARTRQKPRKPQQIRKVHGKFDIWWVLGRSKHKDWVMPKEKGRPIHIRGNRDTLLLQKHEFSS